VYHCFSSLIGAPNDTPFLTDRRLEILQLIAEGLQNKEIAARLKITPKAVEFHKTRLYARIGVTSIAGAVRFAIREGYVDA
jgi:DNA-binding NarL/FixJ family response regulator